MPSIETTLAERGARYGAFIGHAAITQVLKSAAQGTLLETLNNEAFLADVEASQKALAEKWKNLRPDAKEAIEMIFHKIGRILNGDPDYDDSWRDCGGYSKLVEQRITEESEKVAQALVHAEPVKPKGARK